MTQSGKSLLVKSLVRSTRPKGIHSIIFDPTAAGEGYGLNGWEGRVFSDFDRFARCVWASRGCLVIIDEAGDAFTEHRAAARPIITRGRHRGHVCCLIAQRHKLMDKTARDQCSKLYLFTVNRDDAAELALDWNEQALADAYHLPPLHYIALDRHSIPVRGVVRIPGSISGGNARVWKSRGMAGGLTRPCRPNPQPERSAP